MRPSSGGRDASCTNADGLQPQRSAGTVSRRNPGGLREISQRVLAGARRREALSGKVRAGAERRRPVVPPDSPPGPRGRGPGGGGGGRPSGGKTAPRATGGRPVSRRSTT